MVFDETAITKEIIKAFNAKLLSCIESDVLIAGAGPSGLMAAYFLSRAGLKTTIVEKRLAVGGGVWGGGMAMNEVVIQQDALDVVREIGVRAKQSGSEGLFVMDAVELASALSLKAVQSGANIFNLSCVEDVCILEGRVSGLVVNRTTLLDSFPVDPIMLKAKVTVDATGHEAAVVQAVRKHGLRISSRTGEVIGEGAMDAVGGERFVVERAGEVFNGLYVTGMAVCAAFGGPRMGPIFGGMLLSGKKIASIIIEKLKPSPTKKEE